MIPKYSVVIPVYNEEESIKACLETLCRQTTKEPFEVVIADNNSTDKSVEVIKTFSDRLNLVIVPAKKQGRGAARKVGFAHAKADILFSTDADTRVPPRWIASLGSHFLDPKVVGVTTFCYITDCSPRINTVFNLTQPVFATLYRWFFKHYWFSGFSFAIRKEVYEKVGGIDDSLDAQEDTDLSNRVYKLGKILVDRRVKVQMSGRRFKNGLIKGFYPYVKTYIALNALHKDSTYLSSERE